MPISARRARLHEIIFEADTPEGRMFDLLLLIAILGSVLVVLLESVASVRAQVAHCFGPSSGASPRVVLQAMRNQVVAL